MIRECCVALALAAGFAGAQTAPVPSLYQDLYSELQTKVSTLDKTISSQWSGVPYPTLYGSSLLNANANIGLRLLNPTAVPAYRMELDGLKKLGVLAVVVYMAYPLLYQPFLQFNGDPNDYEAIIAFYQGVATVRRRAKPIRRTRPSQRPDQVNVLIPPSLAGAGVVDVTARADNMVSNAVTVQIR